MNTRKPYTFDRVVRIVIAISMTVCTIWLINTLKGVLLPFAVACLIAYLFEPFVQYNRSMLKLRGRTIAVFATLFEAVTLLSIIGYFICPMVADEINQMGVIIQNYSGNKTNIAFLPTGIDEILRRIIDFDAISKSFAGEEGMTILENALRTSWGIISDGVALVMGIFNWFLVVLYVVFIMLDYNNLNNSFRRLVPPRYRNITYKIGRDIKSSMNHYFRGQALVAGIVGVLFAIGFSIIDLPMAIAFGLFIGILNLIPYLQLISLIPAAALCLIYAVGEGADFWLIFWQTIAVYCIVQAIQDLILTPKIMGKAMGLNPAIILLSLSIWGTLLGLIGLIIALPLTTLILSYYNHYIIGDTSDHTPHWRRQQQDAIEKATGFPTDNE